MGEENFDAHGWVKCDSFKGDKKYPKLIPSVNEFFIKSNLKLVETTFSMQLLKLLS
jgi:hypothetical protein